MLPEPTPATPMREVHGRCPAGAGCPCDLCLMHPGKNVPAEGAA